MHFAVTLNSGWLVNETQVFASKEAQLFHELALESKNIARTSYRGKLVFP